MYTQFLNALGVFMGIFLIIGMFAVWSSIFSLGKIALVHSTPIFLTAFRMLLAAVLILGFLAIKDRSALRITKKHIFPLCTFALFSIYLTNLFEFSGLKYLSPAKVSFIYSLSPFFSALFSYIHFGEKMTLKKFIGMTIGFSGFIPIFLMKGDSEHLLQSFTFFSWPELITIGAVFFSIYGWVLLRIMVKGQTLSPLFANGYGMLIGGVIALIHSLIFDQWTPIPTTTGQFLPIVQGVVLMTFISNILCYNLYGYLLRKFTATFLSLVGLLCPIFASFYDWVLRGEVPSWTLFLSTGIVALGLFLVYQTELKQGYIVQAEKEPA